MEKIHMGIVLQKIRAYAMEETHTDRNGNLSIAGFLRECVTQSKRRSNYAIIYFYYIQ